MKFGIISDTHGHLPGAVFRALDGVDRIFHCGDVGDLALLDQLELIAPTLAVAGNVDAGGSRLPLARMERLGDLTVCVAHGHLLPGPAARRLDALLEMFREQQPNLICYGHSHVYAEDWREGILLLNPGSVFRSRGAVGPSLAVVEAEGGQLLTRRIAV